MDGPEGFRRPRFHPSKGFLVSTPCTRLLVLAFLSTLFSGCAAPRANIWDGTSVDRWHVDGHLGMVGDVPAATVVAVGDAQLQAVKVLAGRDSISDSALLHKAAQSLVAASLDMPGMNTVASIHLGLGWGLEAGYRREGGANAWSLRWQFLSAKSSGWNAGIGAMYSSLDYELPSVLGDVQSTLGYSFSRTDVSVPLVFSKPLGEDGEYGSLGGGLVGGWTSTRYGFDPEGLYRKWGGNVRLLEKLPGQKSSFLSYGAAGFAKLGYEHVWLMAGLTVLYQDYGTYQVPGTDPVSLSGVAVLPSLGLEIRI